MGKMLSFSRPESNCIVHCHRAVYDCHLRMEWKPVYIENGTDVIDSGTEPLKEEVALNRILTPIQLQSGVSGHAVARRLHDPGWRAEAIDEGSSQRLQSIGLQA